MPLYLPERFEVVDLHVLHYGYAAERVAARDKGERNRALLELDAAENAGDPFTLFNLGTEHLAAGRPAEAAELLSTAWVAAVTAGGRPPQYLPSLADAARAGAPPRRRPRAGARPPPSRRSRSTRITPTSFARPRCRPATRGDLDRAAALASAASSSATRPRATRARSAPARSSRSACSPRSARPAPLRRGRRAARALARRAPRVHAGSLRARRRRGAAGRRPPAAGRARRDSAELSRARRSRAKPASAPTRSRSTPPGAKRAGNPAALPVDSAPAALALLDRLLELQEFEAFESLAGLWNTLPLPERDRRELLAGIYMARGYLDSAAEEWLADRRVRADRARARRPRPRRARPRARRRRARARRRGAQARSDDRRGARAARRLEAAA